MTPIVGLFIVALIEVGLALAVLARSPHRLVNRWFCAFATTLAVWGTLVGVRRSLGDPTAIVLVVRVLYAVTALIPVAFLHFATVFPRREALRIGVLETLTLLGLFMSGLAFSPWIVAGLEQTAPDYFQPVYGPLFKALGLYIVGCTGLALFILARKLSHSTGFARAQLHYVFLGAALTAGGAVTLGLVVPLVTGSSRYGVYGPYFTLIWLGFTAHSIVRHRLMDIRVVISRTLAYTVGWAITASLVVSGGVLLSTYVLDQRELPAPYAVLLGLSAALTFVALAPRMKALADRYLYRPAYDARQVVREGGRAMGTFADPARMTSAMARLIDRSLQLESLAIVVRPSDRDRFEPFHLHHVNPRATWPVTPLSPDSPLVHLLGETAGALVPGALASRSAWREDPEAVAAELRAWHGEIAVPVRDGQLIGIILAGPKLSGDSFFGEDVDLLETLASELAIGLKNGQLYQQVVSIKEYNERILAHMDSGVIAVREDGIVTTFNPAAERITGLGVGRALHQPLRALDAGIQAVLRDSLDGLRDSETEITVSHLDGRVLPLIVHTSALHDHHGQVRGAIAVLNDHSRLKALEEDKRRADRLAAMGAMASGIAHEIRNPLVAIKTFAELLPERADDQEFRSTFAKVAVKEIHRIETLLGRLRALAVPAVFPLRPMEVQAPLAETLDLVRVEADRRRVRLVVEIERDLPPILGEPDQVKQLCLNLFLNAMEAMTGGGTLSVSVRADLERPDRGLVTVRVTDTGPGIPREDLARVFEPFFTTKTSGTGLGLAICRSIADAHRASLWAESGPAGVGTAFVIQFPALQGARVIETIR